MATASELRQVLIANSDKRDSPEYAELYRRYKRRESEERRERVRLIAREEPDFLDQIEELAKGIPYRAWRARCSRCRSVTRRRVRTSSKSRH